MAVYVDDMNAEFRRMIMCHMIADTHAELIAMADSIGVARKWIQDAGSHLEHFDISLGMKRKALELGAVEIEYGIVLAEMLEQKRRGEYMKPSRIKSLF